MGIVLQQSTPYLEAYTSLDFSESKKYDCIRDGVVLKVRTIWQWIYQQLCDWYNGGSEKQIREEFERFHQEIDPLIRGLNHRITEQEEPLSSEQIEECISYLKLQAKFRVLNSMALISNDDSFIAWEQKVDALLDVLKQKNLTHATDLQKRWIHSSVFQRKLAAISVSWSLPYRYNDLTEGCLLLTDYSFFEKGQSLRDTSFVYRFQKYISNIFIQMTTSAYPYTHAEIIVSRGHGFHSKKLDDEHIGTSVIEQKRSVVSYAHRIFKPNPDEFERVYLEKTGQQKAFREIWAEVRDKCRQYDGQIKTDLWSMISVLSSHSRTESYDCFHDLDDFRERKYACSAMIASIFGSVGVDMGRELGKESQNISPSDFGLSSLFTPLNADHAYL